MNTTLGLLAAGALLAAPVPAGDPPELGALLSSRSLVYVEAPGLADLLERGLDHPFLASLLGSDVGQAVLAEAEQRPEDLLAISDAVLGSPTLATLGALVEDGLALGVDQRLQRPVLTFAARSRDPELWDRTVRRALAWIADENDLGPQYALPQEHVHGADVWFPAPTFFLGVRAGTAVASASEGHLRDALAALEDGGPGLAGEADWRAAAQERDGAELLWAWMDVAGVRAVAPRWKPLRELAAMVENPSVHMLLGTGFALLGRAAGMAGSLELGERTVALELRGTGLGEGAAIGLLPGDADRTVAVPRATPGEVARVVAWRDLGQVVARRAELFPPDVLPAFSKVSNDLAPILGGLDLGEDVLPGLSPWLRVVVRDVEFAPGAEPEIRLPAAALLVDLHEPDELGPRLASAFQTAVGVANLQAAQQGNQPLLLGLAQVGDVTVSHARYLPPAEGEGVDAIYNLEPACAQVGATFVLGTHRALVEELVGQLADGDVETLRDASEHAVLHAGPVARVLRQNFDALAMNNVLEKGLTLPEARGELEALIGLVGLFDHAELRTRDGADEVVFELSLELSADAGESAR